MASNKGKKKVTFSFRGNEDAKVYLSGSFNSWSCNKTVMKYSADSATHTVSLFLPPGKHEYKFYVDETWCVDPSCPNWILNDLGSMNSVIEI